MQPKVIIVWFKRDLRVFDHAPLANAVHDADFVLPLFVVEPDYWQLPTSSRRHWCFVNDCLHELDASLAALGQRLILRIGEMDEVLDELSRHVQIQAIYAHEETGNAWHQAGLDNGGESCEGPPGIRDVKKLMGTDMYLAYLRDPSGNKICALKRMS